MMRKWEERRLKTFLTETKETVGDKSADYTLLSLTKAGVIIRDMNAGGKFPSDFGTYKIVTSGQIIFCLFDVDETPRTVGLSKHNGMITGAYDIFQINDIEPKFLEYYFLAVDDVKGLRPLYTGLRKVINKDTFLQYKIPLPPRAEQEQIVYFLDWKVSGINKLIKAKKRQIDLLQELLKATISDLVSKEGENVLLKRAVRKVDRPYSNADEVLICSNRGKVFFRGDQKLGVLSDRDDIFQGVNPDDLLIHGMDTWHGAIAISNDRGKCTRVVHVCESENDKRFIAYFLRMLAFKKLYKAISNGVRQNTSDFRSWSKCGEIEIKLPCLEKQKEIADYLDKHTILTEKVITRLNAEITLLHEYRTRLIFDVVTGKLDVRDVVVPDYEAVEEAADDKIDEVSEETEGDDE